MAADLSEIINGYKPLFAANFKDESFNSRFIEILEEYTRAVIESMKRYD